MGTGAAELRIYICTCARALCEHVHDYVWGGIECMYACAYSTPRVCVERQATPACARKRTTDAACRENLDLAGNVRVVTVDAKSAVGKSSRKNLELGQRNPANTNRKFMLRTEWLLLTHSALACDADTGARVCRIPSVSPRAAESSGTLGPTVAFAAPLPWCWCRDILVLFVWVVRGRGRASAYVCARVYACG